eukprot:766991-Hanusia_phi.AAC.19
MSRRVETSAAAPRLPCCADLTSPVLLHPSLMVFTCPDTFARDWTCLCRLSGVCFPLTFSRLPLETISSWNFGEIGAAAASQTAESVRDSIIPCITHRHTCQAFSSQRALNLCGCCGRSPSCHYLRRWLLQLCAMNAFLKPDEEREPRHSLQSNISSEADGDWEFVPSPGLLPTDHAIGSSKQQMLPVEILQRAGDWIQWGLDGAVKGVERTYDGEVLNAQGCKELICCGRNQRALALQKGERRAKGRPGVGFEATMEAYGDRTTADKEPLLTIFGREQERSQQEELKRKTELEDQMRVVERVKKQRDEADARLREQESLLKQGKSPPDKTCLSADGLCSAAKIGKDQSQELERLRIEAEQR